MGRFSIKSVVEAKHNETLIPEFLSQLEYFCGNDSHFCVFSDEVTILGVKFEDKQTIVKERISDNNQSIQPYNGNTSEVCTLALDEANSTFLAGEINKSKGNVVQYDIQSGRVLRNYGPIGIGHVLANTRLGCFCFFGAWTSKKFTVVNIRIRELVCEPVETCLNSIVSIKIFEIENEPGNKLYLLTLTGPGFDESGGKNDVFDITELIQLDKCKIQIE